MTRNILAKTSAWTLLLAVLFLAVPGAQAWWDANWQSRRQITLDAAAAGLGQGLGELPVLVRLHTGNFDFTKAKADGADLRFVAGDDQTPLKFHIEKFDPVDELALVWVKVPRLPLTPGGEKVWLYHGNDRAVDGQDAGGTYDVGQQVVLHLGETEGAPRDATAHRNHPAQFSAAGGLPAAIGNGAMFRGAGDQIVIPRSPSLDFSRGFTFSTWVRIGQPQTDTFLFSCEDNDQSLVVGIEQSRPYCRITGSGRTVLTRLAGDLSLQTWHHLAVTAEPNGRVVLYLDGQEAGYSALPMVMPHLASDLAIGVSLRGNHSFSGDLDEVRIAGVARPAAWLLATARGEGPDSSLVTIGAEEADEGGGEGNLTIHLMKVIARSVTLDGWLIIGLCTFMLVLAVYVFVNKFMTLQKLQRGNNAFLEAFGNIDDPLALVESEEFEHSSMYRIYKAGHDEITRWLNRRQEGKKSSALSQSVLNIYRAALDKANVKENQKLHAWLIVMTLSISGGPFWGLLGTVWGVMNTFASLAESGEANLSAIAPGVASALACTLFGLFVAIPALFAYSYLSNRMKNINADTRSFIDELHVKIEGAYGESA